MSRSGLNFHDRLAIAAGGVVGATCRWALGQAFKANDAPAGWFNYAPNTGLVDRGVDATVVSGHWGTVIANLAGCLALGIVATLLLRSPQRRSRRVLLALGTGFCGALTTFATFAVEGVQFLRIASVPAAEVTGPIIDRPVAAAVTYFAISLIGGALAFWLGRTAALRSTST